MKKSFFLFMVFFPMVGTMSAQTTKMSELEYELTDSQKVLVQKTAYENAEDKYAEMTMKYYVPQIVTSDLYQLVLNQEKNKACCSVVYKHDLIKRVKSKLVVDSLYKDSIYTILIPFNNISGENIGFALRLCQRGLCKKAQQDKIMTKALELAHSLDINPRKNVWNEEIDFLEEILDKKQLKTFFELKTLDKINNDCRNAWKNLKEAGFSEQVDSAAEGGLVYAYFEEVNQINEQYKYRENFKNKNLGELYKHRPYAIRLLDGIYEKKHVEENNVGSEFVW